MICCGRPPTKPPMTGLPFHIASAAPRPNDPRTDFCSTMVAARWSALICVCASGGSSRTRMSGSRWAASRSSASTDGLSGSAVRAGTLRPGAVEVTAPHPSSGRGALLHERGRLDVVHEDEVGLEAELLGVHAIHLDEVVERLVRQHALGAAKAALERGGRGVERGIAAR